MVVVHSSPLVILIDSDNTVNVRIIHLKGIRGVTKPKN